MKPSKFSKGAIPVPYTIALVFAIAVVGIFGYYYYSTQGRGIVITTETLCESERRNYCNSLIYGGMQSWKASCGDPPTLEQCLAGDYGGAGNGGNGDDGDNGNGDTYTCENYVRQNCKTACSSSDVGSGLGSCPSGQVCCLGPPPDHKTK